MPGRPFSQAIGDTYLDQDAIAGRVAELGAEITRDYEGHDLLMLSLLKGSVFFMADLARQVRLPLEMDYMAITSYRKEHNDPNHRSVRLLKDVERPLEGKDVLVVQDIVDTGLTLHYVLRLLQMRNPASLHVCTLLDRPYRRLADIPVRYRGFTVPDDFFVGYGFDYHQYHRNLPYLAHLLI
jgi:hypoxanthine phosphoribosyltransferase